MELPTRSEERLGKKRNKQKYNRERWGITELSWDFLLPSAQLNMLMVLGMTRAWLLPLWEREGRRRRVMLEKWGRCRWAGRVKVNVSGCLTDWLCTSLAWAGLLPPSPLSTFQWQLKSASASFNTDKVQGTSTLSQRGITPVVRLACKQSNYAAAGSKP